MPPSPSTLAPDADVLHSVHTTDLPALFERLQISLVVSTYQAGKVIVVRNEGGYILMQGIVGKSLGDTYLADFKAMARSLTLDKQ